MTQTITIRGDTCWLCGNKFDGKIHKKTAHHGIPQNLQPKQNVSLPMCVKCHEEINQQDINTLRAYAHRILKTYQSLPKSVYLLIEKLDTLMEKGDVIKLEDLK